MLTGKWTPMNANVQKFNQLVEETLVHSGENDEDWMTMVEILFRTHTGVDFKHKSVWLFLKGKHKWKNPESTLARRNRLRFTDEEPGHFGENVLPRPPGAQRIAKSQCFSNSTASFGSNPLMYQEMMKEQYELDHKAKMEVIERETNERMRLYHSQRIAEDMKEVQGMENSLSKRRSKGLSSRVLEDAQPLNEHASPSIDSKKKQVARYWRSSRWFPMNCLSLNVQGLGSKAKKDWIKELNNKHKVNFLSVQETMLDCISDMDVKVLSGNYKFEYTISEAVGNSGGILCVWDPSVFRKEHHVVSDNFFALYGSWVSNQAKLLVVSIYAPQSITSKRSLWSYISSLISRWDGHCMVMGDFNEVRCMEDRLGSVYNAQGANEFNSFISNSGLVEIQLEGYSFTWSLQSAKKMSVYVDGEWVDDPWAIEAGIFKGIKIGSSLNISHLFYADDAVFIGEWSIANLSGVMVGGNSSTLQAWDDTIGKLKARLSNWKLKTLSVGGRLTLLKSVLGSTPIYNMSIYKVPKSVLQTMESIRRNFFNGVQCDERKIVWIKWAKVLASKKYGGLGVSSFYALNRALLFKWVWRFISRDNSLWCRLIMSMHGSSLYKLSPFRYSTWKSIIREVHMLKDRGVDLISHCHIRVGNGLRTQFWNEVWIGDTQLRVMFPRIYALEINKDCTVADKLQFSVTSSLRRSVRGGVESSQLALLQTYIEGTLLSNMEDRWVWDLNGEGVFRVKDVRILLDECFLPKAPTATRWVKYVPIKINVFAWKVFLDRLPTRSNLQHRGVLVSDLLCPLCSSAQEDSSHLFFSCRLATDIVRLVCRWWNLSWTPLGSYADWLNWFNSIRLSSKVKDLLEGVLYITWWSVWMFRNQLLFSPKAPRKDVIFDDIVSRSFTWFGSSMRFLGSGGGRMVECENLSPQQPPRTRSSKLISYCENTLLNKSIAENECTLKLYEAAETLDFALAAQGGRMVECENLSPQQPPRTRDDDSVLFSTRSLPRPDIETIWIKLFRRLAAFGRFGDSYLKSFDRSSNCSSHLFSKQWWSDLSGWSLYEIALIQDVHKSFHLMLIGDCNNSILGTESKDVEFNSCKKEVRLSHLYRWSLRWLNVHSQATWKEPTSTRKGTPEFTVDNILDKPTNIDSQSSCKKNIPGDDDVPTVDRHTNLETRIWTIDASIRQVKSAFVLVVIAAFTGSKSGKKLKKVHRAESGKKRKKARNTSLQFCGSALAFSMVAFETRKILKAGKKQAK
ncbi:RNA-directed DNA polymerase, eukaryota [Tanacetum coccineum]